VAVEFVGPLGVALLASRRPIDFVWAGLAAAGIVLVIPPLEAPGRLLPLAHPSAALDPLGLGLALAAGLCWALYIVFGARAGKAMQGGGATALGMLAAALVVLPFGLSHAHVAFETPRIWPLIFVVAVFSSALPYTLEMQALRNIPTRTFGILMSLEPALAALSGRVILGEVLTPRQCLAIACVVAASAGSAASARRR
ncbi:MAG: EamA family transporter, partial [Deltaproteobacteria bacterium]|nr:EamA family transporter [Deltaproteobacteria bacterium]